MAAKRPQVVPALVISTVVSIVFYVYGAYRNHSLDYSYLPWNLGLAWVPLGLSVLLRRLLYQEVWSAWKPLLISVAWLVFLPNTFYMISDYIHLHDAGRADLLFDVIMFTSFIYTSVAIGFASLWLVHIALAQRLGLKPARYWIGAVLLLCSFGIYIGRDLRWNSWDVLTNPAGLLFDVSDRLLHAINYPQMFVTTLGFFALLASMYSVVWHIAASLRESK